MSSTTNLRGLVRKRTIPTERPPLVRIEGVAWSAQRISTAVKLGFLDRNVYHHITKLCRQQAEVIQNHENEHVPSIRQGEARHRKYKRLKLGGGQAYDLSSN
jgi:hypothetical protein